MTDQGEVVLVPVPFTDLTSQKRRPVIVISNDAYNRAGADIVVVAMTSNPAAVPFSFRIDSVDLVEGTLNHPGTVRADKIYALSKSIVVKKFGKVSPAIVERIRQSIESLSTPTV